MATYSNVPALSTPHWGAALAASSLLLQGLLGAAEASAGALLQLLFFTACAGAALAWRRSPGAQLALGCGLGGLGMMAGAWLDQGSVHCALPIDPLSWSGGLMLLGCAIGCIAPARHALGGRAALSHVCVLVAMMLAMLAAQRLLAGPRAPAPAWAIHPAMLAAMALGGWSGHRLAAALARPKR